MSNKPWEADTAEKQTQTEHLFGPCKKVLKLTLHTVWQNGLPSAVSLFTYADTDFNKGFNCEDFYF